MPLDADFGHTVSARHSYCDKAGQSGRAWADRAWARDLLNWPGSRSRRFIQEIHMKKTLALSVCAILPLMMSVAYGQTSGASSSSTASATAPGGVGGSVPPAAGPTGPANTGASGANSPAAQQVHGQSVKSGMMGEAVYNESGDKVGNIKDVVLDSDGKATDVIIGAGGFLGIGEHDVAVPFDSISHVEDKLILSGYTKDQLKALPRAKVTP